MIIGIAAKARSGKDTFAEFLRDSFKEKYNIAFGFWAFAEKLKMMCADWFGLTSVQLWGDDKEKMTRYGKNEMGRLGLSSDPADYWTSREIMQFVGQFFRTIDYDFWIKKLHESLQNHAVKDVIITDVRHINECEYIKEHGILIKIVRGEQQKIHGMDHISEVALDDKPDEYFDIVVHNDGTLDDLRHAANDTADAIMKLQNLKEKGESYNG